MPRKISIEELLKQHPKIEEPMKIDGERAQQLVQDFMLSKPTDGYTPEEMAFREELVKRVVKLPEGTMVDMRANP